VLPVCLLAPRTFLFTTTAVASRFWECHSFLGGCAGIAIQEWSNSSFCILALQHLVSEAAILLFSDTVLVFLICKSNELFKTAPTVLALPLDYG
jgi:hypothetical protein